MIARAESGQARDDMIEFDAAEIAHDIGELYEPLAEEKGIALKVEADAPAPVTRQPRTGQPGARQSGRQRHQIRDAARAAANGRQRRRSWCAPHNEGDRILLTVADHGPGIPEADRARAVERFVRLEQSRSQPGSGLGLSLAAAVARLHGGELTLADNEPGPEEHHCFAARRAGTEWGMTLPGDPNTVLGDKRHSTGASDDALAARIVTAPRLIEPEAAQARVAAWLAETAAG